MTLQHSIFLVYFFGSCILFCNSLASNPCFVGASVCNKVSPFLHVLVVLFHCPGLEVRNGCDGEAWVTINEINLYLRGVLCGSRLYGNMLINAQPAPKG